MNAKPETIGKTLEQKILHWFSNGETGISSKTIAFKMIGEEYKDSYHPLDPADFKRCLKLIIQVPEIRPRLGEMKEVSENWRKLVENWDEVEKSFMEEVPEWLTNEYSKKRAFKTYDLMQKIYQS